MYGTGTGIQGQRSAALHTLQCCPPPHRLHAVLISAFAQTPTTARNALLPADFCSSFKNSPAVFFGKPSFLPSFQCQSPYLWPGAPHFYHHCSIFHNLSWKQIMTITNCIYMYHYYIYTAIIYIAIIYS